MGVRNHTASSNQQEAELEHSTAAAALQTFLVHADAQFQHLAQELGHWVLASPRTLAEIEQQTLAAVKDVGQQVLQGVCQVAAAGEPMPPTTRCACGQQAAYQRQRPAQVKTVLGPITIQRAYYHCTACHQGVAPVDRLLGYCAGSTSAGLDEVLALLGATTDSFGAASARLEKLTLVHISPNVVRAATETLGQVLQATEQAIAQAAWTQGTVPPASATPTQLYVSMDGVLVHTAAQWREYKVGSVYTTTTRPSITHPERDDICAQAISYVGDVAEAAAFGQLLWCEAARRGVLTAQEIVVLADGAHWIWNLADEHFPGATQILDWYHASHYLWEAAQAIYGEGTPLAKRWAKRRLAELWDGQVPKVLRALGKAPQREAVQEASTYYTYHEQRMCYADYRARGLQIGSGTMESGCKQIATARLKQAGMLWSLAGVRAVAAVRTWFKSDRWAEAMALRPLRQRTYHRQAA